MRHEASTFLYGTGGKRSLIAVPAQLLLWTFFACLVGASRAQASVAVLLEQPYGQLGTFNPTGHSALYFDHVCADTPVRLRVCGPGEQGVVISRYDGIGTLDWVAVPIVPYLYAVDAVAEAPTRVDRLTVLRMRDVYRREHLEAVAPDTEAGGMPDGNWYELVGSAYDRTIYGFQVATTAEQDADIIALFNDRPNISRYSGAFRNCADFVRVTVDRLYPHAIRRNLVADFGLTTPKAVARSLTHYARKHPETGFQVFQIQQVPGDLPRSVGVQGVTESLIKRYGVPLALLSPQATAVVLIAYIGRGRFSVPKEARVLDLTPALTVAPEMAEVPAWAAGAPPEPARAPRTGFGQALAGGAVEAPDVAAPFGAPELTTFPLQTAPASFSADVICSECSHTQFLP